MKRATTGALILALLCGSAGAWQFFHADDLLRTIDQHSDEQVFVVDQIVQVWENDDELHPNFRKLPIDDYWRFDTAHFTCVVSKDNSVAIERVRSIFADSKKLRNDDGSIRYDRRPPLLAIRGTVVQAELWGEREASRDTEVNKPWHILVVDEVETPRERFFEDHRRNRRP